FFFFFNDTATTEIYTLSLHDALPICRNDPSLSRSGTAYGQYLGTVHGFRPRSIRRAAAFAGTDASTAPYLLLLSCVISASCKVHLSSARAHVYRAKIDTSPSGESYIRF